MCCKYTTNLKNIDIKGQFKYFFANYSVILTTFIYEK